jgi:3-hydroxybutyryl-CoA dehydrogenase
MKQMKILVLGEKHQLEEFLERVNESEFIDFKTNYRDIQKYVGLYDVIFDFLFDEELEVLEKYMINPELSVFINSVKGSLSEIMAYFQSDTTKLIGMNGLPTFINRPVWEITYVNDDLEPVVQRIMNQINIDFIRVNDQVGMVSARVISMIINEAFYTVQEKIATKDDIDQAMKLGTNYPYGPFEWCNAIGISNVYELIEALYQDTKDERYKISPLMRREYLQTLN